MTPKIVREHPFEHLQDSFPDGVAGFAENLLGPFESVKGWKPNFDIEPAGFPHAGPEIAVLIAADPP